MKYIVEQTTWLENRKKTWDNPFSELIMSFHEEIEELVDVLKEDFNDKSDPYKIHEKYANYINDAFGALRESVKDVKEEEVLTKLWDELSLNIVFWKEEFKKYMDSMDNYNAVFKLGHEFFNIFIVYNTNKIKTEYYDLLQGSMDDKREKISKFIKKVKTDIINRIVKINVDDIFSMTNLYDKETEDFSTNHGDEVRYYMNDNEENVAIISHNQEDLTEEKNIRLISKKDGESFEISSSNLIEILPKHKTLNQKIADKLKKIKDNPEKLEELGDYLDKINISENLTNVDNIDNIDNIIKNIFPTASNINYNEENNTLYFNINDKINEVKIIYSNGIFKEEDVYRVIGSNISKSPTTDYINFKQKYETYVFKFEKNMIEFLTNGDMLFKHELLEDSTKK